MRVSPTLVFLTSAWLAAPLLAASIPGFQATIHTLELDAIEGLAAAGSDLSLVGFGELDGRAVYEHDYGYPQHDHLYCKECQKLIEFQSSKLLELRDEVASEHRFRVAGHRLIVTGVCEQCTQARRRKKRKQDLL